MVSMILQESESVNKEGRWIVALLGICVGITSTEIVSLWHVLIPSLQLGV